MPNEDNGSESAQACVVRRDAAALRESRRRSTGHTSAIGTPFAIGAALWTIFVSKSCSLCFPGRGPPCYAAYDFAASCLRSFGLPGEGCSSGR